MSRHRNVRSMNFKDEYDDYYSNSYGQSYEEEFCVSPGTAAQYMFSRDSTNEQPGLFDVNQTPQLPSKEDSDADSSSRRSSISINLPTDPVLQAKLASCVTEMQNVVGDTIPESELRFAAIKYDYNFELALNSVLHTECSSKTVPKSSFEAAGHNSRPSSLFPINVVNKNKELNFKLNPTFNKMAKNKATALATTAARPTSVGSVGLSRVTSKTIDEEDDFEAAFLSDIHLPSKDSSQKSSILTRSKLALPTPSFRPPQSMPSFKLAPLKHSFANVPVIKKSAVKSAPPTTITSGLEHKSDFSSAKEFLDQLHRTKVFLNSNLPLLDMDPKLYSTLCDQYRQVRRAFENRQSQSFHVLTARHKTKRPDSGLKTKFLFVVPIARSLYEQFYSHGLDQLSAETRQQLECGILGKRKSPEKDNKNDSKPSKTDQLDKSIKKISIRNEPELADKKLDKPFQLRAPVQEKRFSSPIRTDPPVEKSSKIPKPSDPNLNLKEFQKTRGAQKPVINLIVVGHVDAGKSTLMGHLLYKLGYVSPKKMHSYESNAKKLGKTSFLYAWVLDETDEERSRGITMDVAQTTFETPTKQVVLLDAPGHRDFIPNMITGAAQADVAILVVDATRGEFEAGFELGGQTREHTLLLKSLGVSQLAVAINKLDNVQWSKERFEEIENKLRPFLKQAGFKLSDVSFVPCSGLSGENLHERSKNDQLRVWYDGPCLVELIDSFRPPERLISKHLRFYVNDVFKSVGSSSLSVSGRVEAGAVKSGQKLVLMPSNEICVIKNIQADDENVQSAFAGDNVSLTLVNCDPNNVSIGSVICEQGALSPVATRFQARILVFHNASLPITIGFTVNLHYKSLNESAVITKLISQLDKSNGEVIRRSPRCLPKNSSGLVEIEINKPICLELYQDYKDLGRFMLRYRGNTIAAGLITKIF